MLRSHQFLPVTLLWANVQCRHKMHNPVDKMAFLGFVAGIWVGFGGIAATTVAGGMCSPYISTFAHAILGIPREIREEWPVLPKLGVALFFPFALVGSSFADLRASIMLTGIHSTSSFSLVESYSPETV